MKVDFQGLRVTSDGGLILVRELHENLGLSGLIAQPMTDLRRGKNKQLPLADLLSQSAYTHKAGYEDFNDAVGPSQDPTFRLIGSENICERGTALTSRGQSFDINLFTQEVNLAGPATINCELIAKGETIGSAQLDVALVVLHWLLRQNSIISSDRLHIHHRLLECGLAPCRVVLVLSIAAGVAAGIASLRTILNNIYAGLVFLVFCGVTWFGVKNVEYQNLRLANRIVSMNTFPQILWSQMTLETIRRHMSAADTPETYWKVVRTIASELGFCRVCMTLDNMNFSDSFDKSASTPPWPITIPLEGGGQIELEHRFEKPVSVMNLAPLTHLLRSCITPRTEQRLEMKTIGTNEKLQLLRKAANV